MDVRNLVMYTDVYAQYFNVYFVNANKAHRTHPVTDRQLYLQIQPTTILAGTFSWHATII